MIWVFIGKLGSGKTLGMVAAGDEMKGYGYKTQSNIPISYSELWNYRKVLKFEVEGTCLLVDEIPTILDSRNNPQANRQFSYFILQSRHVTNHIIGTAQRMNLTDKRLEEYTDRLIECVRFPPMPMFLSPKEQLEPPEAIGFISYERNDLSGGWEEIGRELIMWKELEPYANMYKSHGKDSTVLPIEMEQAKTVKWEDIMKAYELVGKKGSFVNYLERKYPSVSPMDLETVFDLLKNGEADEAKGFVEDLA